MATLTTKGERRRICPIWDVRRRGTFHGRGFRAALPWGIGRVPLLAFYPKQFAPSHERYGRTALLTYLSIRRRASCLPYSSSPFLSGKRHSPSLFHRILPSCQGFLFFGMGSRHCFPSVSGRPSPVFRRFRRFSPSIPPPQFRPAANMRTAAVRKSFIIGPRRRANIG